jgi:hypothetical protein
VVDYALRQKDAAALYDFWWAVEQFRANVGRGFYLDLWDRYQKRAEAAGLDGRDADLLRYYVCQKNEGFTPLLVSEQATVPYAPYWQEHLIPLAHPLVNLEGSDAKAVGERRLLYAVLNLYGSLYPDIVEAQGRKAFEQQLAAAERATVCEVPATGGVLNISAGFAEAPAQGRTTFVQLLAFLYRSLDHYQTTDLAALVEKLVKRLGRDPSGESGRATAGTLTRLLKHWAAVTPLVRALLDEKCKFRFWVAPPAHPVVLPSYHGTDNFICLVGVRKVGKTHLMFASEAASRLPPAAGPRVPELSVLHADGDAEAVENARKHWLAGSPLDSDYRATLDQSMYAHTAVRGLCRFTFYDIPGEDLYQNDRPGPSDWLREHFEKRKPCGVLMMIDRQQPGCEPYLPLIDLLEAQLGGQNAQYRDMPIYFVLSKADQLLVGDPGLRQELARFLNGREEMRPGFRFPSDRFDPDVKSVDDLRQRFRDSASCCRNLAFLNHLLSDLDRLGPLINKCLAGGYRDLSFVYTTCLPGKDPGCEAVRVLWEDLSRFLGESTVDSRKRYYEAAFEAQPAEHCKAVGDFGAQARVGVDDLILQAQALEDLVARAGPQGPADFDSLARTGGDTDAILAALPEKSGYLLIARYLDAYAANKDELTAELGRAIPALLREPGIPYRLKVDEVRRRRYQRPENPKLLPGPSGSTVARQFVGTDKFAQLAKDFEAKVVAAARDFNAGQPADKVLVGTGGEVDQAAIAGIISHVADLLLHADAIVRQEVAFNSRFGVLNTLCPYKDREANQAEEEALSMRGVGALVEEVIADRVLADRPGAPPDGAPPPRDAAKKRLQDRRRMLLHLLKHFQPRYPQFAYDKPLDLDRYKVAVLNQLRSQRVKLDEDLVWLATALLEVRDSVEAEQRNKAEIRDRYQAKYLLQVLRGRNFGVAKFQANPAAYRATLAQARVALEAALNPPHQYVVLTDHAAQQASLDTFHEGANEVYNGFVNLTPADLPTRGMATLREMLVAGILFGKIGVLVGGQPEDVQQLHKYAVADFRLAELYQYRNRLQDYVKARQYLILLERALYLKQAGWLDGLGLADTQFCLPARDPSSVTPPENAVPEKILEVFVAGVRRLRERDSLWRDPAQAGGA